MARQTKEPSETGGSEFLEEEVADDLNLDDLGVSLAKSTIDVDPRSLPMIVAGIVFCGLFFMLFKEVAQTLTAFVIALLFALALDPVVRKVEFLSFGRFRGVKKSDADEPVQKIGRYGAVPQSRSDSPDQFRGEFPAAHPRFGPLYTRPDPGARCVHAGHEGRRAASRQHHGRIDQVIHAALQFPVLLGRRSAPDPWAGTPRDRSWCSR